MSRYIDWHVYFDLKHARGETAVEKLENFFEDQDLVHQVEIWEIYNFAKMLAERIDDIDALTTGRWSGYFNTTGYYALFFENEHDAVAVKLRWL